MDKHESKLEGLIESAERLQRELEQLVENLDRMTKAARRESAWEPSFGPGREQASGMINAG
jgi:hypothetical protein